MDQVYVGTKDDIKEARYQVEDYSVTRHYRFGYYTVIDTSRLDERGNPEVICECYKKSCAHAVAVALSIAARDATFPRD